MKTQSPYQKQIQKINDLMRSGGTLSGYERHCAFLNAEGRQFATVSALSGFDFEDDGRALALMDWDRDGRVDLWTANRTAPQLRFLHNRCPRAGNWIALRLQGTASNRDAIGARVEVLVSDDGSSRQTRSLKAGEGFLSQSSKWLHFGLGDASEAVTLRIRWRSGRLEIVDDVPVNNHHKIVEGSGQAVIAAPLAARDAGEPSSRPLVVPADVSGASVYLHQRVPLPGLRYEDGASGRTEIRQLK